MAGLPTVTLTHTKVAVATSTTQLLAANADREWVLLVNDSDTVIYVKAGVAAVVNEGIRLNASGGSLELSARLGNLDTRVINAIHGGAATKNLLISEG